MAKLLAGVVFLFVIGGAGTVAHAAPWCAFYGPSTYNCGFHTYAQCLATVRGAGGWCRQNSSRAAIASRPGEGRVTIGTESSQCGSSDVGIA